MIEDANVVRSVVKRRFEDAISKARDRNWSADVSKVLDFVLAEGREYQVEGVQTLPRFDFEPVIMHCYANSLRVIMAVGGDCLYCEGWGMLETSVGEPRLHAWNLIHGEIVDTTWCALNVKKCYFGLVIPSEFVLLHCLIPDSIASCLPAWIGKHTGTAERSVDVMFGMLF